MTSKSKAIAEKMDYSKNPVKVQDPDWGGFWIYGDAAKIIDGYGAEPMPVSGGSWVREDAPTLEKPAAMVFDYGKPVKVAALANYFYVPGCRDQRWSDWLSGPSAFKEVKLYSSNDNTTWTQVANLKDLPTQCPQLLEIQKPKESRYLKIEVLSLAEGSKRLCTYEIETYLNTPPTDLHKKAEMKSIRRGFPNKIMTQSPPIRAKSKVTFNADSKSLDYALSNGKGGFGGQIEVRINDQPLRFDKSMVGTSPDIKGKLSVSAKAVKAGLRLKFDWKGAVKAPYPKLDVLTKMSDIPSEWCLPAYHLSKEMPANAVSVHNQIMGTCMSIVGNQTQSLGVIPDTDQGWVGVQKEYAYASFPLRGESPEVMLIASEGGWFSAFQKAVVDVYGFDRPLQFSPASQAFPDICRWLLQPDLWSEKYQMLRSFPGIDFFYIFYSLPYCIPALSYWETLSADPSVGDKVDKILRFTLNLQLKDGPMKGAMFSEYADQDLVRKSQVPYGYPPGYAWHVNYPDEPLVGMCQGCNRWITSHNMGAVLWAVSHVWTTRGFLAPDIKEQAMNVADWMVRQMREDGSWPYAWNEKGEITSPMSDSGTIWNVWALDRWAKLTGEKKYAQAAAKCRAYFKSTFTDNHLYRGYWEDNYPNGATVLNAAQGYESAVAAIAFAEMGDKEAMKSSSGDSLRFICTRVLESRTYWSSYGGAAEQQGWAPGTYIVCTFGYAAHQTWRQTGDDFFRRFGSLAKTIGWWQDSNGGAFWLGEAVLQQPIEMFKHGGGGRQYWALWDSAQKVAFGIPWLADEVNRCSDDKFKINPTSLAGTDDNGRGVVARVFMGGVTSTSGQVNWLGFKEVGKESNYQLALVNHGEKTTATVTSPFTEPPRSCRLFADGGVQDCAMKQNGPVLAVQIPAEAMVAVEW